MTQLILFGAGASFGSEPNGHPTPPLGPELFSHLEQKSAFFSNIDVELKSVFKQDFEKGMSEYINAPRMNLPEFQRQLATFFYDYTPSASSAYAEILGIANPSRTIFGTLNYDVLFEESALGLGFATNYSDQRDNQKEVRLLKLHGGCNIWPMNFGLRGNISMVGANVYVDVPCEFLNLEQSKARMLCPSGVPPVIAAYEPTKRVNVGRSTINNQQEMWAKAAIQATKIIIIGAKIHLSDGHIWNSLIESFSPIWYVGMPSDREAFDSLKHARGRKKKSYFLESTFLDAVCRMRSILS